MGASPQHAESMPHIQIKHVPPALHQALKDRAAAEGKTLSNFLIEQLTEDLARPTTADFERWVNEPPLFDLEPGEAAAIIREARGE